MSGPSARLAWAARCLEVQPGDRLLELGCGHGVVVSLVCERLRDGHIVGLDRSPAMTAAALRRNREHVDAGRATIVTAPLNEADLGGARFDKVFGVHFPPFLRGDPGRELDAVRRHLAPGGRLLILLQPFTAAGAEPAIGRLRGLLDAGAFTVEDVRVDPLGAAPGVCVVAADARGDARGGP